MRSLFQFLTPTLSARFPFALTLVFLITFPWCDDTPSEPNREPANTEPTRNINAWLADISTGRASMYSRVAAYLLYTNDNEIGETTWYVRQGGGSPYEMKPVYERLGSPTPLWNLVTDPNEASMVYEDQQARFWRATASAVANTVFRDYAKAAYGHDAGAIASASSLDLANDFLEVVAKQAIPSFATFYDEFDTPLTIAFAYVQSASSFASAAEQMTAEALANVSLGMTATRVDYFWQNYRADVFGIEQKLAQLHELTEAEASFWTKRGEGVDVTQELVDNLDQQLELLDSDKLNIRVNFVCCLGKSIWVRDKTLWSAFIDNQDASNCGILDAIPDESCWPASNAPPNYFTGVQQSIRAFLSADPAHIRACLAFLRNNGPNPNLPVEGLVAYYPFNGDANDASGQGHHGTVYGAVQTSDRFGNANRAYSFDGINDYIRISSSAGMNYGNISVSAWAKLSRLVGPTQARIICKQVTNGGIESWGLQVFGNNYSGLGDYNKFTFHSANCVVNRNLVSATSLAPARWYHVVGINDGHNLKLYLDGALNATISSVGNTCVTNTAAIVIGKTSPIEDFFFPGAIDDIRIYNRVLTESEIKALYNEGR